MTKNIVLEKAAQDVANQSKKVPRIYQLPVEEGRKVLEDAQNSYVYKYPCRIIVNLINTNNGIVKTYIVIPDYTINPNNIIFYIHGAGWVFGSFHTHEKLVRELAYRTNSVLIFPEYTRSPEAKFPVAINQCYNILNQIPIILKYNHITPKRNNLIVAGDSVGGNMAIAMCLLSKMNSDPKINKLLLYYPVTDDNFNIESYIQFAEDYYLYREGMIWFWDNYEPNVEKRKNIFATPLNASIEELKNFPDTMIINGEADVLKSEGEAFANKLREANNNVTQATLQGMIHDFVMLNSLDKTNACRVAMNLSVSWINDND